MKKNLLSLLLILITGGAFAQTNTRDMATIDAGDTVVFDLAQSVVQSGYVEFPVLFRSDDIINALDFSLKYNTAELELDTIIRLAPSHFTMQYNLTGDTTLYFTSYSLQTITNDTALAKIRFNILSGQLCSGDLNSVSVYLNGEVCTVKVTDAPGCPLSIFENEKNISFLSVYPNPSEGIASLDYYSAKSEIISLFVSDISGRKIINERMHSNSGFNKHILQLENLPSGIYILTLVTSGYSETIRLSKQ